MYKVKRGEGLRTRKRKEIHQNAAAKGTAGLEK